MIGTRRAARFVPKNVETLHECMKPFVGRVFTFEWYGTMDEGDYAGQFMWIPIREHDAELGEDAAGRWFPDEDLQDLEPPK